ncbi:hypothetical protein NCCP2331_08260 [Sporosarcina sp. NCCP-2331]|nr:hypothetical protein NCCP2331_08260 [Sporosarcina sp. NCCP-2331]GLB54454.1 hypothetical protein NCCP2378_02390 [Sporosarcina sp. NCCP-2378]
MNFHETYVNKAIAIANRIDLVSLAKINRKLIIIIIACENFLLDSDMDKITKKDVKSIYGPIIFEFK